MHLSDPVELAIAVALALLGAAMLIVHRTERGFGQRKQAGVMFLAASLVFAALGMGYLGG